MRAVARFAALAVGWAVAQVIRNVVDYGMDPQSAIDAPRVWDTNKQHADCGRPNSASPHVFWDRDLPHATRQDLAERGHHTDEISDPFGLGVAQVAVPLPDGSWEAGSDTRALMVGGIAKVSKDGSIVVTSPPPYSPLAGAQLPATTAECVTSGVGNA